MFTIQLIWVILGKLCAKIKKFGIHGNNLFRVLLWADHLNMQKKADKDPTKS